MKFLVIFLFLHSCIPIDNNTVLIRQNNIKKIKVEIRGHVKNEGYYVLLENTRLSDLINKAGGLKSNAEQLEDFVLKHNQVIFINSKLYSNKIDLNNTNYNELVDLKYLNKNVARNIIDYSIKNRFNSVLDLKKVKGIKEKTFKKIYQYFKV